jgi:hypothetical protein
MTDFLLLGVRYILFVTRWYKQHKILYSDTSTHFTEILSPPVINTSISMLERGAGEHNARNHYDGRFKYSARQHPALSQHRNCIL